MAKYTQHIAPSSVRQPAFGKKQVQNSDGAFVFKADDWTRLDRFLILGSEGATYYATERTLTRQNAAVVQRCLKKDPARTLAVVGTISKEGRAPKNDQAIFALALAMASDDVKAKHAVREHYDDIIRIGTHQFQLQDMLDDLGKGWGRVRVETTQGWYTEMPVSRLGYQLAKYKSRHGYTHRDLLRLSHPKASGARNDMFGYVTSGEFPSERPHDEFAQSHLTGMYLASKTDSIHRIIELIEDYGLTHEMIPTEFKNKPAVQEALLVKMPLFAMIRNLGNYTRSGLLAPMSNATNMVLQKLDYIHKARVHPLGVLVAAKTYASGRGFARQKAVGYHTRGYVSQSSVKTWVPVQAIVDKLDDAFYASFGNVEPAGKNTMIAIDISPSMDWDLNSLPITAREAAGLMGMVTARTEPSCMTYKFAGRSYHSASLEATNLSPRMRFDDVMRNISKHGWGGTDLSLPMLYAIEQNLPIDTFVILTDNETNTGIHPYQALQRYRQASGRPAKVVVVAMTANDISIADPSDGGMLDVVGFDTHAPNIISGFSQASLA